jgi:RHS repeat-associated protein
LRLHTGNNGNAVTRNDSSGITTFAWDYENRLTSVTLPGSGGTVSFKYDPFGRRIYRSSSSGTSVFAYDGDNLIEETNASGAAVARYSQGLDIDEPFAMLRGSATSFYEADGLGSITSLSNSSASITDTYTFDSFGKLTASTGTTVNPFRYTARESDAETGLYFYRARYYDPSAGRFLSEDPVQSAGSPYPYVDNDPADYVDPTGLSRVKVCLNTMKLILTDANGKPIFCPDVKAVGCSSTPTPKGKFPLGPWQRQSGQTAILVITSSDRISCLCSGQAASASTAGSAVAPFRRGSVYCSGPAHMGVLDSPTTT